MAQNHEDPSEKPASDIAKALLECLHDGVGLGPLKAALKKAGYVTTIPLIAAAVVGIGGLLLLLPAAFDSDPEFFIAGIIYLAFCVAGAWLIAWLICWQIEALRRKEPPEQKNK